MSDFTDDLDALGDFPEEYNPWHNPDDWKTITRLREALQRILDIDGGQTKVGDIAHAALVQS